MDAFKEMSVSGVINKWNICYEMFFIESIMKWIKPVLFNYFATPRKVPTHFIS